MHGQSGSPLDGYQHTTSSGVLRLGSFSSSSYHSNTIKCDFVVSHFLALSHAALTAVLPYVCKNADTPGFYNKRVTSKPANLRVR